MAGHDAALLRHHLRRALHLGRDRGYSAQPVRYGFIDDPPGLSPSSRCSCRRSCSTRCFCGRRARACCIRIPGRCRASPGSSIAALLLVLGSFIYFAQFHRRAARLDLRAGAYRGRQIRAGADRDDRGRDAPTQARRRRMARRRRAAAPARRARSRRRGSARGRRRGAQRAARPADRRRSTSPPRRCRTRSCAASRPPASRRCRPASSTAPITVVIDGQPFEVTTLRQDVETYGRHAKVAFGRDWKRRRRAARLHHQRAVGDARRHGLRLCRRARRSAARRVRFIGDAAASASRKTTCASCASSASTPPMARRPSRRRRACRLHRRPRRARPIVARARAHGVDEARGRAARGADADRHDRRRPAAARARRRVAISASFENMAKVEAAIGADARPGAPARRARRVRWRRTPSGCGRSCG